MGEPCGSPTLHAGWGSPGTRDSPSSRRRRIRSAMSATSCSRSFWRSSRVRTMSSRFGTRRPQRPCLRPHMLTSLPLGSLHEALEIVLKHVQRAQPGVQQRAALAGQAVRPLCRARQVGTPFRCDQVLLFECPQHAIEVPDVDALLPEQRGTSSSSSYPCVGLSASRTSNAASPNRSTRARTTQPVSVRRRFRGRKRPWRMSRSYVTHI